MSEKVVIEKDFAGMMLTSALASQIRGEIIASQAPVVDIIIRNVCTIGNLPEVIVDYGGDILQTYCAALKLLLLEKIKESGTLIKEVDSLEYLGKHGAPGSIVP